MPGEASGLPARGGPASGVWPPFERENVAAVKYGAHTERFISPLADRFTSWLLTASPHLARFPAAVAAWARAEALCVLLSDFLDVVGVLGNDDIRRHLLSRLNSAATGGVKMSPCFAFLRMSRSCAASSGETVARFVSPERANVASCLTADSLIKRI